MSTPWLEIISPGPLASLQDLGRRGLRRVGIPWAGVLAPHWQSMANVLVGNPREHPVVECFEGGLTLESSAPGLRVAVAGDATIELQDSGGSTRQCGSWQSLELGAGDRLRITTSGRARCSYVGIHGLAVRSHHGSASTYARAGLGGLDGGVLKPGDRLMARSVEASLPGLALRPALAETAVTALLAGADGLQVFAVPGPQQDAFSCDELERFFNTDWTIGTETDRMGARLDGATLRHLNAGLQDIVSDAIVPGAVQVPGNGRPILMLADAATVGGYPKIATVASCDLAAVALARPGTQLRFVACTPAQALTRTRDAAAALSALLAGIEPATRRPDTTRLLQSNLIDGVVDASHT